jgi:hypothetical protein
MKIENNEGKMAQEESKNDVSQDGEKISFFGKEGG